MNSRNTFKHELKCVLSWVHLSVLWECGIHSHCTTGGTQLRRDSFGESHVQRNMSIDLGH